MDELIKLIVQLLKIIGAIILMVSPLYILGWAMEKDTKLAKFITMFGFAFFSAAGLFGITMVIFPIHLIFPDGTVGLLAQFGLCFIVMLCILFFGR